MAQLSPNSDQRERLFVAIVVHLHQDRRRRDELLRLVSVSTKRRLLLVSKVLSCASVCVASRPRLMDDTNDIASRFVFEFRFESKDNSGRIQFSYLE